MMKRFFLAATIFLGLYGAFYNFQFSVANGSLASGIATRPVVKPAIEPAIKPDEADRTATMEALKPLQVILGKWRGTTRREFDRFKAVDSHEWIWDLKTNPQQPALVMKSNKSPYFRSASLTWDEGKQLFQLTATTPKKETQTFLGTFSQPVKDVEGDDNKLQRVFSLKLTETDESAGDRRERWQVEISQQNNDRYLLQVDRRRGKAAFRRYDTVSTQREGTSFAINDSDYGEKECLISQGLGTIAVSYKGKTYWVCCSGCKAAFEEEPEVWIARAAEREKSK